MTEVMPNEFICVCQLIFFSFQENCFEYYKKEIVFSVDVGMFVRKMCYVQHDVSTLPAYLLWIKVNI